MTPGSAQAGGALQSILPGDGVVHWLKAGLQHHAVERLILTLGICKSCRQGKTENTVSKRNSKFQKPRAGFADRDCEWSAKWQ